MIDDKPTLKKLIELRDFNKRFRNLIALYNISDTYGYIINRGELEKNNIVHLDRFFVYKERVLNSFGDLAISVEGLYDALKNVKVTKSCMLPKEKGYIVLEDKKEKDDVIDIRFANSSFINGLRERYAVLKNQTYIDRIYDEYNSFIKLDSIDVDMITNDMQISVNINDTPVLIDKELFTKSIKKDAEIRIGSVKDICNYNEKKKDLICVTEGIPISNNDIGAILFTVFAIQKI